MTPYEATTRVPGTGRSGTKEADVLVGQQLHRLGLRSSHLRMASMGTIALCVLFWTRASSFDQDERGNAERRAIFVGLWAPTFWLIGQSQREFE
jgi:hypothetical protein